MKIDGRPRVKNLIITLSSRKMSFDILPIDVIRQIVANVGTVCGHEYYQEILFESMPDQTLEIFEPQTRLLKAIIYGCIKHINSALTDGADINKPTFVKKPWENEPWESFRTPLQVACDVSEPNVKIVKLLVEHGANVNDIGYTNDSSCRGQECRTPLMLAVDSCNPNRELINYLLEQGADVNKASDKGCNPNKKGLLNGKTPLWQLLSSTQFALGIFGSSKLPSLPFENLHLEDSDIKIQLLEAGANPNCYRQALLKQAIEGHDENVEILLRYGAEDNRCVYTRRTALESVQDILNSERPPRPGPYRKSLKRIVRLLGGDAPDDDSDGDIFYVEAIRRQIEENQKQIERLEKKRKR